MMHSSERRTANRQEINYPIVFTEGTSIGRVHLAQVLDAGTKGIRVLLAGAKPLQVGSELDLSGSFACNSENGQAWQPVHCRCKVAWQDLDNNQVGLIYIQ